MSNQVIIQLHQKLAKLEVENKIKVKEALNFHKQCMIDEALSRCRSHTEAAKLLGFTSRTIFRYKKGD